MTPEILERETVYNGYMRVQRVRVRLPDGAEVWREVERHGDAVAVLPYDSQRRCALTVRLFRLPAFELLRQSALEEACAGMIDGADADEASAARREALEELGVRLGDLARIGRCWSSPGVSAERVSLFVAPYSVADRSQPGRRRGGRARRDHRGRNPPCNACGLCRSGPHRRSETADPHPGAARAHAWSVRGHSAAR